MSRSKENWDFLVDYYGNYLDQANPAITKLLAGKGIKLNPPEGVGIVSISADENYLLVPGDNISDLNNDVGYLTEVEHLDNIKDVTVPNPEDGQALVWSAANSAWVAARQKLPSTFMFRGVVDCSVEHPDADPEVGWVYIQGGTDAAEPLESWVGIANREIVNIKDLIVYGSNDRWQRIENTFELTTIFDLQVVNEPADPNYPQGRLEFNDTTATLHYYQTDRPWLPDLTNDNLQAGTLDDRYVNVVGDTMSGDLSFTNSAKVRFTSSSHEVVFADSLNVTIDGYPTPSFTLTEYGLKLWGKSFAVIDENTLTTVEVVSETGGPREIGAYLTTVVDDDLSMVNRKFVEDLVGSGGVGVFVEKAGDTMHGPLQLGTDADYNGELKIQSQDSPNKMLLRATADANAQGGEGVYNGRISESNHLVNKKYVDDVGLKFVKKTGDEMSGDLKIAKKDATLTLEGPAQQTIHFSSDLQLEHSSGKIILSASNSRGVEVRNGLNLLTDNNQSILSTSVTVSPGSSSISYFGEVTDPKHIVTKEYADSVGGDFLPLTGGHVTGAVEIGNDLYTGDAVLSVMPTPEMSTQLYTQYCILAQAPNYLNSLDKDQGLLILKDRFANIELDVAENRLIYNGVSYFNKQFYVDVTTEDKKFSVTDSGPSAGEESNPFEAYKDNHLITKKLLDSRLVISDDPPTPVGNEPQLWFDSSEDSLSSFIYYGGVWIPFSVPPSVTSRIAENELKLSKIRQAAETATDFDSFKAQIIAALS